MIYCPIQLQPPSHVPCGTPPFSYSFSWYLWILTSVLLGFSSHSSVLSIAQLLPICPKYALCGSKMVAFVVKKVVSLMRNKQQRENLLLKVDQHSPFHNNFLQPATNCWSCKVKKRETSIQNLQQTNLRVSVSCILPHICTFCWHTSPSPQRFGVCMYQLVTFWLPNWILLLDCRKLTQAYHFFKSFHITLTVRYKTFKEKVSSTPGKSSKIR